MNAQLPEDYRVYNKTQCTAYVTAYCSDNSSTSATLPSNGYFTDACPTNEALCYVTMVLPSSVSLLTVNDIPMAPICPNSGEFLPADACYTQNDQWTIVSGRVVCNIY